MRSMLPLLAVAVTARTTCAFTIRTPKSHPSLRHQSKLPMTNDGNTENPLGGGELTSALARLDQEWQLEQKAKGPASRWSKIVLPREEEYGQVTEQAPTFETEQDFVYLLEPPSSNPSCVVCFLGGAGLGQFPQVAYNEFLLRISDKLNAAVITAPYQVGLDHFALSKQSGQRLRKAIMYCQDDPARQYPENLPIYSLSHSLGAKLQTIYVAATQQDYDGIGFLAFNNFDFSQTISMAKSFADEIQKQQGRSFTSPAGMNNELLDTIFSFAEQAIGAIGLDFSPSKADTSRLIEMRFDEECQKKTRLFVFDDDTLDSSRSFVEDCQGSGPSLSGLPGNHLTPVFFQLGLDNLEMTEEMRDMAAEAAGGMSGASFGNEQELDSLVDEVCSWIKGQGPSREPTWDNYEATASDRPRIAGGKA